MLIKRKERLVQVATRIPESIKNEIAEMAKSNGVNPAEIYREAIVVFFSRECSEKVNDKVHKKGGGDDQK